MQSNHAAVVLISLLATACLGPVWLVFPAAARDARAAGEGRFLPEAATQRHSPKFVHYRKSLREEGVAAPASQGTLYSFATLDISQEPVVLSVLAMGNRTWHVEVTDGLHRKSHTLERETADDRDYHFAFVGPDCAEAISPDLVELRMPTNILLLSARASIDADEDNATVLALQDKFRLSPISRWYRKRPHGQIGPKLILHRSNYELSVWPD